VFHPWLISFDFIRVRICRRLPSRSRPAGETYDGLTPIGMCRGLTRSSLANVTDITPFFDSAETFSGSTGTGNAIDREKVPVGRSRR
jgi:hypothetical protein